jgi:hypothetical protein
MNKILVQRRMQATSRAWHRCGRNTRRCNGSVSAVQVAHHVPLYDETVQHYTMEKRKVNKNEKDVFARQRVQFGIRDYESGNTYRDVDMYKLFDNMDENGNFDESMFKNIISYRDESFKILSNALSVGFKIEFCEDDQYPENKERISKYWKITKNSITIKI